MTERTKPLVVTSIDSAEESKPPRLNCTDNFAGSGIIDVITPRSRWLVNSGSSGWPGHRPS